MTLTADSVAGLFGGTVALTMNGGRSVSPRGMATREVLDVNLRLTRPRARLLLAPPARILNPAFAIAETVWILSGSDDPWIFDFNGRLRQFADGESCAAPMARGCAAGVGGSTSWHGSSRP